jgi:putative flavoprotein involved in K+ transport
VATGAFRVPKVPELASDLDASIVQLHSSEYRNPGQLRPGHVLVVGVGNSGAEIALELSRTHRVTLAGKPAGQIPVRHGSRPSRVFFRVFRFFGHHVVTRRNPIGRRLLPKLLSKADPLVRTRTRDLEAAGVERVGRVTGVRDGRPVVEDGTPLETDNVVWATGYRHDFPWIDLPAFDADGQPVHERGIVPGVPGLSFVGLAGQFSFSSDVLPSRMRDAGYVAKRVAADASRVPGAVEPVSAPA